MKNLIPFDLEKALAGEAVITRDGRAVKISGHNPYARDCYQIAGWCSDEVYGWSLRGEFMGGSPHGADLFMAPKPVEVYAVVYPKGIAQIHECLDAAKEYGCYTATSVSKLTIINGEVVSAEVVHKY